MAQLRVTRDVFVGEFRYWSLTPISNMKTFLYLIAFTALLITTGCELDEHEHYRGGYYGPGEYGHGEYREYHPYYAPRHYDWDHDD